MGKSLRNVGAARGFTSRPSGADPGRQPRASLIGAVVLYWPERRRRCVAFALYLGLSTICDIMVAVLLHPAGGHPAGGAATTTRRLHGHPRSSLGPPPERAGHDRAAGSTTDGRGDHRSGRAGRYRAAARWRRLILRPDRDRLQSASGCVVATRVDRAARRHGCRLPRAWAASSLGIDFEGGVAAGRSRRPATVRWSEARETIEPMPASRAHAKTLTAEQRATPDPGAGRRGPRRAQDAVAPRLCRARRT